MSQREVACRVLRLPSAKRIPWGPDVLDFHGLLSQPTNLPFPPGLVLPICLERTGIYCFTTLRTIQCFQEFWLGLLGRVFILCF